MKRASLGTSTLAVVALALAPLAITPPAQAEQGVRAARNGPDKTFNTQQRHAAIADARASRGQTEKALHLGKKESLVVEDVRKDQSGAEHIRYDRTYAGLPVIGGDLVVHEKATGKIRTVDWASPMKIAVKSTKASVAPGAATTKAARSTDLKQRSAGARKVVYAAHHKPVLAWESTVTGTAKDGTPIVDLVYTDAHTGKQLGVLPQVMDADGTGNSLYSGTVALKTVQSGSTYQLDDTTRGGSKTYDANNSTSQTSTGTLFTDADNVWGNGSTSSRQSAAVDAAYGAAETWDFYKSTFGRNGIRDDGAAAYSKVHYGNNYENAFWYDPCFCMTYGDGGSTLKTVAALDVAGHEMSHGVTASTSGLDYTGDAGGLNESTSDVMGTMVEFYAANANDPGDYYIGEKIMKDGTYLRRMDNPSADGGSVNCWSTSTKNLDPHYSSGVGNHLFYLLAEGTGSKTIGGRAHNGTTCNGSSLTGIGRDAAAAIWYRALTTYWTSTTNYPQAANGMVKAAKDLYGTTSTQCTATVAAWTGVSVTPTETCGSSTPPTGGANLLANPGFESGATSWTSSSGAITNSTNGIANTGSYYAWLDGYGSSHTDTVTQSVTIPSASAASLSFYKGSSYVKRSVDLSSYTGGTVTLKFLGVEDSAAATSFLVDDTSLTAS